MGYTGLRTEGQWGRTGLPLLPQLQARTWEAWPLVGDAVRHHHMVATQTGKTELHNAASELPPSSVKGCWSLKLPAHTCWGLGRGDCGVA